jgi:hypothetical protein
LAKLLLNGVFTGEKTEGGPIKALRFEVRNRIFQHLYAIEGSDNFADLIRHGNPPDLRPFGPSPLDLANMSVAARQCALSHRPRRLEGTLLDAASKSSI